MLKRVLMVVCGLFVCAFDAEAAKRALLIGVADYQAQNCEINGKQDTCDLNGPVNDVRLMQKRLQSAYGFRDADMRVLVNEQATRANIERTFAEWLLNGTSAGDLTVFFFSGHGSQVPDANGDEDDGKDEVLLPYDMTPDLGQNILVDDELGAWLRKLTGRQVVVILDSCFSGGATRGRGDEILGVLEATSGWRSRYLPLAAYQPTAAAKTLPRSSDVPPAVIVMAASQEFEDAREKNFPEGVYGGFTFALCDSMARLTHPTYGKLFEEAYDVVIDRLQLPQIPYLKASDTQLTDSAFASETETEKPSPVPAPSVAPDTAAEHQTPAPTPALAAAVGDKVLVALEPCPDCATDGMAQLREQLSKLPMVELVAPAAFFDRLIRIAKQDGQYQPRLLNGVGDAWELASVAALPEIAQRVTPGLEYAYMVKQLARLTPKRKPFQVDITLSDGNRRDFKIGEQIVFTIKAERDCYLLLLNLDSQGNVRVIFPNQLHQENFLRAQTPMEIPDEQMRAQQFVFEFGQPVGEETVKVIATTKPLKLEELGLAEFKELFQTLSEKTRAILIKDMQQQLAALGLEWNEDTVTIRSHE